MTSDISAELLLDMEKQRDRARLEAKSNREFLDAMAKRLVEAQRPACPPKVWELLGLMTVPGESDEVKRWAARLAIAMGKGE